MASDDRDPTIARDAVAVRLQRIARLLRRVERRVADGLGVNGTDLSAMEHLISDGPLTASELSGRLRISTAAGTHVVDRLERAGHVSRRPHPSDRRKLVVTPAEESVDRAFGLLGPMLQGLDTVVGELDAADRAVVERFLDRVAEVYTLAAEGTAPATTTAQEDTP